jgi:hypothetical protein
LRNNGIQWLPLVQQWSLVPNCCKNDQGQWWKAPLSNNALGSY